MISETALVAPIGLPAEAYDDIRDNVTVSARADLGVDIRTVAGATQLTVQGTALPLETVIAPHRSTATFLPAGTVALLNADPLPSGPLTRDAWAIEVGTDAGWLRDLLPEGIPVPALWLLEGIDAGSVDDLFDSWLDGDVEAVNPQPEACHQQTAPAERGATADDTWRTRMRTGTWGEVVAAEVPLGLVSASGDAPSLTVRAFASDHTEIPVAAVLEAFATVDPPLMSGHPVVAQCAGLAASLPVRIFVRFDVWDVDLRGLDPKGDTWTHRPDAVRLVPDDSGAAITGLTTTWVDPHTVGEIARSEVQGRDFHVEVDFSASTRIRLEWDRARYWPDPPAGWTWSTSGWTAWDGVTPGSWQGFTGVQIGTDTSPATFWVGSKVRLVVQFEEQQRDYFGERSGVVKKRRVAPGHEVGLYAEKALPLIDGYATDADGEVSAVSFAVGPGSRLGVAVRRNPTVDGLELVAGDEPDHLYQERVGLGSLTDREYLFSDGSYFWSEHAREPILHDSFTSGLLAGEVLIDADPLDDTKGNTAHAAAFHAVKFALLTHEALTMLKGDGDGLPTHEELHLVPALADDPTTAFTSIFRPGVGDLVDPMAAPLTRSLLPPSDWFTRSSVVHECAHQIWIWLAGILADPEREEIYLHAGRAYQRRFLDERGEDSFWHSYALITNSGAALSEGLPQIVQQYLEAGRDLPAHDAPHPPAGKEDWPRYRFEVQEFVGTGGRIRSRALTDRSGRNVEGVLAEAVYEYLGDTTGLRTLYSAATDTETGCQRPSEYLDAWLADPVSDLAQLHRMVNWLLVDPIRAVIGEEDPQNWGGFWPRSGGDYYPTVLDFLLRVSDQDPAGQSPWESFARFHDWYLVPWNLEQDDGNPGLGLDWAP